MDTTADAQFNQHTGIESQKIATIHNDHDPSIKHSNKSIDPEMTKMNTHWTVKPLDDVLNDVWGSVAKDKNEKLKAQYELGKLSKYNYEHRQVNIRDLTENKNVMSDVVLTLGDVDSTRDLLNLLHIDYVEKPWGGARGKESKLTAPRITKPEDQKKWSKINELAIRKWVEKFDGHGFNVSNVWVHLDEGGAPHAHVQTVLDGRTPTGKVSHNQNNAIVAFLRANNAKVVKDTRTNMRTLRYVTDTLLVDSYNETFKELGITQKLSLIRKHSETKGLDMETFKALAEEGDKLRNQKTLNEQAKKDNDRHEKALAQREKEFKEREEALNAREKALDDRETKIDNKNAELKKHEDVINHESADFINAVNKLSNGLLKDVDTLDTAAKRLNYMKSSNAKQLNAQVDTFNSRAKQLKQQQQQIEQNNETIAKQQKQKQQFENDNRSFLTKIIQLVVERLISALRKELDEWVESEKQEAVANYKEQQKLDKADVEEVANFEKQQKLKARQRRENEHNLVTNFVNKNVHTIADDVVNGINTTAMNKRIEATMDNNKSIYMKMDTAERDTSSPHKPLVVKQVEKQLKKQTGKPKQKDKDDEQLLP